MLFHNCNLRVSGQVKEAVDLLFNDEMFDTILRIDHRLDEENIYELCQAIQNLFDEKEMKTKMTLRQQKRMRIHRMYLTNAIFKNHLIGQEYKNMTFIAKPFTLKISELEDNQIQCNSRSASWVIRSKAQNNVLPRSHKLFLLCMFNGINSVAFDIVYNAYVDYLKTLNGLNK